MIVLSISTKRLGLPFEDAPSHVNLLKEEGESLTVRLQRKQAPKSSLRKIDLITDVEI